jgi:hypothetical protein
MCTAFSRASLVLVFVTVTSAIVAALAGQDVRYEGTVSAIEKTRIQVTRAENGSPKDLWFGVTPETPVVEADRSMTFEAAKLKKNVRIVVTALAPEGSPSKEWSCTMHTHVAEERPGKCPVCGMALVERDRAPQARQIHVTKR